MSATLLLFAVVLFGPACLFLVIIGTCSRGNSKREGNSIEKKGKNAAQMSVYLKLGRLAMRFRKLLWQGAAYFDDPNNAPEFKRLLVASGPVFIKIGQWITQRPDVFPQAFIKQLESLQRDAPQHSFEETLHQLGSIDFDRFDKVPIASGSIAQVYRARYLGTEVVVKVRHPDIMARVNEDLLLLKAAIKLGAAAGSFHCQVVDVERVTREMLLQCNLKHEKKCLEDISKNFSGNPYVHFPEPLFASESVLIETYCDGIPFAYLGDPQKDPFRYKDDAERELARRLAKQATMAAFFQMILNDALLHADLHNGNQLYHICRKPKKGTDQGERTGEENEGRTEFGGELEARVTLLDMGMVVQLSDLHMNAVHQLMVGLYGVDCETVVEALSKVAMQNNDLTAAQKMDRFRVDCGVLIDSLDVEQNATGGIDIASVMERLLKLLHTHRLLVDGNLIRVMVDFVLISEGQKNLKTDNLTDNTIKWVLYCLDEDYFFITDHLFSIPISCDKRRMKETGREPLNEQKKAHDSGIRSLSAARTEKFLAVDSLTSAFVIQKQQDEINTNCVLRSKTKTRQRVAVAVK